MSAEATTLFISERRTLFEKVRASKIWCCVETRTVNSASRIWQGWGKRLATYLALVERSALCKAQTYRRWGRHTVNGRISKYGRSNKSEWVVKKMKSWPTEAMGGKSALMYSVRREPRLEAELRIAFRIRPDPGSSPHKDQASDVHRHRILRLYWFLLSRLYMYCVFANIVVYIANTWENLLFCTVHPVSCWGCVSADVSAGVRAGLASRSAGHHRHTQLGIRAMWRNHSKAIQSTECIQPDTLDIIVTSQLWP